MNQQKQPTHEDLLVEVLALFAEIEMAENINAKIDILDRVRPLGNKIADLLERVTFQ